MKRAIATLAMLLCMVSLQAQTLLIYGGSDHDVFLGKLNADCYDSESIWNEYGTYGRNTAASLSGTNTGPMEVSTAVTRLGTSMPQRLR